MGKTWVVLLVALIGTQVLNGFPVRSTPPSFPVDSRASSIFDEWGLGRLYAIVPALGLLIAAVGLVFGCTWCYRHKDCKIFAASVPHLHELRRNNAPDSGFSEPVNNNVTEDNNNGPISLRELQNIANNNATVYIASDNEQRNRISLESVVEFEPLPSEIRVADPLERCTDWFGYEDFQRNKLQYLREIGRGWFGRVVEGEIEVDGGTLTVAVKVLNQNASLDDKARFLDEAKMYRDVRHENILAFVAKCLEEDPWMLIFELCSLDLQQYLVTNRPKMAILNESGITLQLMCDVASALAHLHAQRYVYGNLWSGNVLVRERHDGTRAVLGQYSKSEPQHDCRAPELTAYPEQHTMQSDVWSLGTLVWEICAWGVLPPTATPPPLDLPCPYRNHLYQVMQLCWNINPEVRPTSVQVYALINHLYTTHTQSGEATQGDGYGGTDFEERWQILKPNTIPKIDEHVAIVHAPFTSIASHFSGSEQEFDNMHTIQDSLSTDLYTAVSRSSSILSDKDPLSTQMKSESLTNLHGSLEDVRNIYLTHVETAVIDCHQANINLDDRDTDHDRSDSSVDPWLKDIIAGSQDDVSYYRDVSDVIKNLDNILNSEKTSSSESSHQASPSRDNLSLNCKKEQPLQSNMVKSPGISNFQNVIEMGFEVESQKDACDNEVDRDTIGTLSHSFERHSDTASQHTLENLTPDTPVNDVDGIVKITSINYINKSIDDKKDKESFHGRTKLPKDKVNREISLPTLKELCLSLLPTSSISSTKRDSEILDKFNVSKDCQISCDNNLTSIVRADNKQSETKSVDNTFSNPIVNCTVHESVEKLSPNDEELLKDMVLSKHVEQLCSRKYSDTLVPNEAFAHETDLENTSFNLKILSNNNEKSHDSLEEKCNPDLKIHETVVSIHLADKTEATKYLVDENEVKKAKYELNETCNVPNDENLIAIKNDNLEMEKKRNIFETPEVVQNLRGIKKSNAFLHNAEDNEKELLIFKDFILTDTAPEKVQNIATNSIEDFHVLKNNKQNEILHDSFNDRTVYMDLVNDKETNVYEDESPNDKIKEIIKSCLGSSSIDNSCYLLNNESTRYLDLPKTIKDTDCLLQSERLLSSQQLNFPDTVWASTPKGSDMSADYTFDNTIKDIDNKMLSETVVPIVSLGLSKQQCALENVSPIESPTKSHHTDTYDENSSVVLGPFENCTFDFHKGVKSHTEELLAFSSNFSEIDVETPSPLRDGNFLNEVPDIFNDDLHFDDIEIISEENKDDKKNSRSGNNTDKTDGKSIAENHISPLTPPNSPGDILVSSSHNKYLVNSDSSGSNLVLKAPDPSPSTLENNVDLNQIDLQITSKLAMAENENNMNIEYSGPLIIESIDSNKVMELEVENAIQESYLAGNGGSEDDSREGFSLDEESVKALRNELELKLPLAQVSTLEPPCESDTWSGELPPPPELVVSYPGALSPIVEETGQQLTAYENDVNWNPSTRTDSSESYPEPCNNSTDEVTDLPTGAQSDPQEHSTYTIYSKDNSAKNTYTIQKDVAFSRALTISDASLNASPAKALQDEYNTLIYDKTINKIDDDKESFCERISQVSPYLVSPTTDTSAPVNSDNIDNFTGISTLSKTTQPTDQKLSKPSETQCLSKATSIDSWCSNDTLYNVEENFDDLVMDTDIPADSESSNTLTHHVDDQTDLSHCSTYIVRDSQSEPCETFSPDSITAHGNGTYTKIKTKIVDDSLSPLKSYINDLTKNTETKDLAYESLVTGLPSCSNYTMEIVTGLDEYWKLPQLELVRRSPITDEMKSTPPKPYKESIRDIEDSPKLISKSHFNKMDSVEISCLHNASLESRDKSEASVNSPVIMQVQDSPTEITVNDSLNYHYRNMANSVTSTPLIEQNVDKADCNGFPMHLPELKTNVIDKVTNFQNFLHSAELRPQDISYNTNNDNTSANQDGVSVSTVRKGNDYQFNIPDSQSTSYIYFENSALRKPQDIQYCSKSSQSSGSDNNILEEKNDAVNAKSDSLVVVSDYPSNVSVVELLVTNKPDDALQNSEKKKQKETNVIEKCNKHVILDSIPNYSDFECSATNNSQNSSQRNTKNINANIMFAVNRSSNKDFVSDSMQNYSNFERYVLKNLQDTTQGANKETEEFSCNNYNRLVSILENDSSNSKIEGSVLNVQQNSVQKVEINVIEITKNVADESGNKDFGSNAMPNYSDFESSATNKAQNSIQKEENARRETEALCGHSSNNLVLVTELAVIDSDAVATNLQEMDVIKTTKIVGDESVNKDLASNSLPNYSDFENSATYKPQESFLNHRSTTDKTKYLGSHSSKSLVSISDSLPNYSDIETSASNKQQQQDSMQKIEMIINEKINVAINERTQITNNSEVPVMNIPKPYVEKNESNEDETKVMVSPSCKNLVSNLDCVPNYLDFENSVTNKPQDSLQKSSQSFESAPSSEEFKLFEISSRIRPQDLPSAADATTMLLKSERILSEEYVSLNKELEGNQKSIKIRKTDVSESLTSQNSIVVSKTNNSHDNQSSTKCNQSIVSEIDSEKFQKLYTSISTKPQNLSLVTDACCLLLKSERTAYELEEAKMDNSEITSQIRNIDLELLTIDVNHLNMDTTKSQDIDSSRIILNDLVTVYDAEEETEQPHSFIITENLKDSTKDKIESTYDSHTGPLHADINDSYDSHSNRFEKIDSNISKKGEGNKRIADLTFNEIKSEKKVLRDPREKCDIDFPEDNALISKKVMDCYSDSPKKFATVNVLHETFEELMESNVDDILLINDLDNKSTTKPLHPKNMQKEDLSNSAPANLGETCEENMSPKETLKEEDIVINGIRNQKTITENFISNEKRFCQLNYYIPLLNDIRFTGPASEIMTTSFTQESPDEQGPLVDEAQGLSNTAADILKDWDSDTDSHSTNSSSGEFIWKDGDGHETSVVPSTFDQQRHGDAPVDEAADAGDGVASTSGDSGSGSGSEGDEVEFVPSSWDCRAAPSKSSLRSLEQAPLALESKKRVIFKRQKYHCVYEYPREVADVECDSYMPDFSTYTEWEPSSAEEAELGYGQLFGAPNPLDLYPLRAGVAFDYDEDFFISSSARPFESLGLMTTSSQFFPGMHLKSGLIDRDVVDDASDDVTDHFPAPNVTWTPSLDFTTPDSGVEDITPSTTEEYCQKKLPESECWKPVDSGSSSESVSPSSPGGESLGGLRHTRDKLKLDLPPSPHIPSPRHNRVFNFVLEKPKRKTQGQPSGTTPIVMTDETPITTTNLPLHDCEDLTVPEPTFSTFGKSGNKVEQKSEIILTDEVNSESEVKESSDSKVNVIEDVKVIEAVKGEGTVLDSGDEDSGIESSSKATLERKTTPNVS